MTQTWKCEYGMRYETHWMTWNIDEEHWGMAYLSLACPKSSINRQGTFVSKFHHHLQLLLRLDAKSERGVILYLWNNVQQRVLLIIKTCFEGSPLPTFARSLGRMDVSPKAPPLAFDKCSSRPPATECIAGDNIIGKGQLSHILCVLLHDLSGWESKCMHLSYFHLQFFWKPSP